MLDEDAIEHAFWDVVAERARTGAERDAFKHAVRALLWKHLQPLYQGLETSMLYLTAYKTGFEPPGGFARAHRIAKDLDMLLEPFLRTPR